MASEWAWQQRDYDKAVDRLLKGRPIRSPALRPVHGGCKHAHVVVNAKQESMCTTCGERWVS